MTDVVSEMRENISSLRSALMLLLDQVDYTDGACGVTEPVGGVLDKAVIVQCREVLTKTN